MPKPCRGCGGEKLRGKGVVYCANCKPASRLKKNIEFREEDPIRYILIVAKSRAKKKQWEYNLTREDIDIPEFCPVLGIKLEFNWGKGVKGGLYNSPSLDRVDSSKGYVKGNMRVISHRANTLKRDATLDEVRKILAYMERNVDGGRENG